MKIFYRTTLLFLSLGILLSAFTSRPGGEGFEIYLNNKVVVQQFGKEMDQVKSLRLEKTSTNVKLTIRYHHCGRVGKNRVITIKDAQDKLLHTFRYQDATSGVSEMTLPVRDLFSLNKGYSPTLKVYYTSTELPNGRMIVSLHTGKGEVVSR